MISNSSLSSLPDDSLQEIIFYLPFKERVSLLSCCHVLRRQLQREELWAAALREFWDVSKFPSTYIEFIKDRRARRIVLLKLALGPQLPLKLAPHFLIDLYEDLSYFYSSLMTRVYPPSNCDMEPTAEIFTSIAVEIARRYPFLTPSTGYGGYLRYSSIWEVKAYGNPPVGYVEPPDAGFNDIRLKMDVFDPDRCTYYLQEIPNADFSTAIGQPGLHIVVSYVYDNGYDGGYTFYRDASQLAVVKWSCASKLVDDIDAMVQRYSAIVVGNLHLSLSCGWIPRSYWSHRFEAHVKDLNHNRAAAARLITPQLGYVKTTVHRNLLDLASILDHTGTVQTLDAICFDPAFSERRRSSPPSANPLVAVVRCAIRASRYIILPLLAACFDNRNNTLGQDLHGPYDAFIRGTTTESNWRNHFNLEPGVPTERQLCGRRQSVGFSSLCVQRPYADLWPLWATEMMSRLVIDMVSLAALAAVVRLKLACLNDARRLAQEIVSSLDTLRELQTDASRIHSCLDILGLVAYE